MHNKARQNRNISDAKTFVTPKKFKIPSNENFKQIRINNYLENNCKHTSYKILLLSKRLEYILTKLQLNADELISLIQN